MRVKSLQGESMANEDWHTPPEFLEVVRKVHGVIDLDPASSPEAQERVQAANYFTKEQDGLSQPWHGKVFLNPPYSRGLIGKFVDKLIAELDAGRVTAAIMLTNNCADTKWFAKAARAATATCFPRARIKFLTPAGKTVGSPPQGQAVFYFGPDPGPVFEQFRCVGLVGKLSRRSAPSRARRLRSLLASEDTDGSEQKQRMSTHRASLPAAKVKKRATSKRSKRH